MDTPKNNLNGQFNGPVKRVEIENLVRLLATPFRVASNVLHSAIPHNRKHSEIVLGVCMMLGGSKLATSYNGAWHFIVDAIAYLIHGIGCAPIVDAVLRKENGSAATDGGAQ